MRGRWSHAILLSSLIVWTLVWSPAAHGQQSAPSGFASVAPNKAPTEVPHEVPTLIDPQDMSQEDRVRMGWLAAGEIAVGLAGVSLAGTSVLIGLCSTGIGCVVSGAVVTLLVVNRYRILGLGAAHAYQAAQGRYMGLASRDNALGLPYPDDVTRTAQDTWEFFGADAREARSDAIKEALVDGWDWADAAIMQVTADVASMLSDLNGADSGCD